MPESLDVARRYARAWIGDATTVDEIVEAIAPNLVILWDIVSRAEETMCWWAEKASEHGAAGPAEEVQPSDDSGASR